jgi:hypothetical protein
MAAFRVDASSLGIKKMSTSFWFSWATLRIVAESKVCRKKLARARFAHAQRLRCSDDRM